MLSQYPVVTEWNQQNEKPSKFTDFIDWNLVMDAKDLNWGFENLYFLEAFIVMEGGLYKHRPLYIW